MKNIVSFTPVAEYQLFADERLNAAAMRKMRRQERRENDRKRTLAEKQKTAANAARRTLRAVRKTVKAS